MKILFVTNLCPHYRVKTFEELARRVPTEFVFFSQGGERYWTAQMQGKTEGDFPHEYLSGFSVGSIRVTPSLVEKVWRSDADVIIKCINGRFALPITFLLARLRRKPFVLWTGIWSHPHTLFHRLTFPFTRAMYRRADAVAVYGEHVRRYLIGLGVRSERIFVAHHALDNDVYSRPVGRREQGELRNALNLDRNRIVLFVGRLEPEKGLGHLVEAVAGIAHLQPALVFVGDGSERQHLEAHCASRGVSARFLGTLSTMELYRYYSIADVFVLPSIATQHGREPWGLVINEAMNQGVPVIASEAVGAAAGGFVRDEETGLVVPERDSAALARAIARLLGDPELARRLGEAGRRAVLLQTNERLVDGFVAAIEYAAGAR